eukprot:1600825-Pleurochrysis_carterae.AAC.2
MRKRRTLHGRALLRFSGSVRPCLCIVCDFAGDTGAGCEKVTRSRMLGGCEAGAAATAVPHAAVPQACRSHSRG